jgi:catechol-2,3-dioxygenase
MSAAALAPVPGVMLTHGFAELTIEVSDLAALERLAARLEQAGHPYRGPVDHDGGDRSLYVEDLEGNVVEVWDFFERGAGRRHGAGALAGDDVQPVDP